MCTWAFQVLYSRAWQTSVATWPDVRDIWMFIWVEWDVYLSRMNHIKYSLQGTGPKVKYQIVLILYIVILSLWCRFVLWGLSLYQIGKLSLAGDLTLFWGFLNHTSLKWIKILISPVQSNGKIVILGICVIQMAKDDVIHERPPKYTARASSFVNTHDSP